MVQRPLEGKTAVLWVGGGVLERKQRTPVLVVQRALEGKTAGGFRKGSKGRQFWSYRGLWRAKQLSFGGGGGCGKEAKDASFGRTEEAKDASFGVERALEGKTAVLWGGGEGGGFW